MWNIIESFVDQYGSSVNNVGKYWITMFNVLRLMFLFSIVSPSWSDEDLVCDTGAPGCAKLCTNEFFPFSPIHLWELQMIAVMLPVITFVSYSGWKIERIKMALKKQYEMYQKSPDKVKLDEEIEKKRKNLTDAFESLKNTKAKTYKKLPEMTISERKKALSSVATTERYLKTRWDKMQTEEDVINQPLNEEVNVCDPEMRQYFPRIFIYYFFVVLLRTAIEFLFDYAFYVIFADHFFNWMPEQYLCEVGSPCNGRVSCFIDRPKQKTFFLLAMMAFSIVTIMTGLLELWSLGLGNLYEAFKGWSIDITDEYQISKTEQMFGAHRGTGGGFVNFQGTRVDHMRDEIGEDEENVFVGI